MKEDSIEICTINCASLHSILCMRRKAVKLKLYLRLKKQIGNLDGLFELRKCKTLLFSLAIYTSMHTVSFRDTHLKNKYTQSGQSCVPLTSSII